MRTDMIPFQLFMTADAVGGVFQYALDLASCLCAHGVHMTLAMLGPPMRADQRAAAGRIGGLEVIETGLPLDWLARDAEAVAATASAMAKLAAAAGAHVVHLNTPALAAARYPAPVVTVAHSCLASWWASVKGAELPADFVWRTRLMARGLKAADAVVSPSQAFARMIAAIYGLDALVVRNGRTAADPAAGAADGTLDRQPEISAFTAGRLWDEGKNLRVLDDATARMNLRLYAAGPLKGPHGSRISVQNLTPLGTLDQAQVRAQLARRPIFVSAALYEPFGLAVLEAAQAGCALVLSDIPTFRELWHEAALFVPARDARAFADAMTSLAADPTRRARLGAAARIRSRRYSSEATAGDMARLYRRLVHRIGAGAASDRQEAIV